jgi:putative peptidoglycan lipid II flippase
MHFLLNTLLNIILMFPFGHIGIALGSSIAAWFNIYLLNHYAKSQNLIKYDVDISKFLIKTILVAISMGIIVFYVKYLLYDNFLNSFILIKALYLLLIIGIGIISYFSLSIFFGLISKSQLLQLCKKN